MKIKIKKVEIMQGPIYAYRDGIFNDDGEIIRDPGFTTYDYFVVCQAADNGRLLTHVQSFDHLDWHRPQEEAQRLADRIQQAGSIDSDHWVSGSPWYQYSEPETWEEEKIRELEWEANLSEADRWNIHCGGCA